MVVPRSTGTLTARSSKTRCDHGHLFLSAPIEIGRQGSALVPPVAGASVRAGYPWRGSRRLRTALAGAAPHRPRRLSRPGPVVTRHRRSGIPRSSRPRPQARHRPPRASVKRRPHHPRAPRVQPRLLGPRPTQVGKRQPAGPRCWPRCWCRRCSPGAAGRPARLCNRRRAHVYRERAMGSLCPGGRAGAGGCAPADPAPPSGVCGPSPCLTRCSPDDGEEPVDGQVGCAPGAPRAGAGGRASAEIFVVLESTPELKPIALPSTTLPREERAGGELCSPPRDLKPNRRYPRRGFVVPRSHPRAPRRSPCPLFPLP